MIAARLGERTAELSISVQNILLDEIAELRSDAQMLELMVDTVAANIDTVFSAIRHAIPIEQVEPPTAALEHARRLAQRGVSINALTRAYRRGHKAVLEAAYQEIRQSELDPRLGLDTFGRMTMVTFDYIDQISAQVVAAYEQERSRWQESWNSLRALRVRELLDGGDVDVDAVTTAIRYPLRRTHLALVLSSHDDSGGDELVTLERFAQDIAESLGATESALFVAVDRLTGWAWIPLIPETASAAIATLHRLWQTHPDGPAIAAGQPAPGVAGFRQSHRQAQGVRDVALSLGPTAPQVIAAGDAGVAIAALVGGDIGAARAWVVEVLGPLAGTGDSDERLRETLRVYLRSGSSFKAAADELHLHYNSVKYRVRRAVERRGRPIGTDRLEVEVALLLCQWYGEAVLSTR